jgi:hypothetical protein
MGFGSMAVSISQWAEAPKVSVVVGDIDETVVGAVAGCRSNIFSARKLSLA